MTASANASSRLPSVGPSAMRTPFGTHSPLGPRRRWLPLAIESLERQLDAPVRVTQTRRERLVDVLGVYGLKTDRATERIGGYAITPGEGTVDRTDFDGSEIRLSGSPGGSLWLQLLIERGSAGWARAAALEGLGSHEMQRMAQRLRRGLIARWSANGKLDRLRREVELAFALDPELVRLARQITSRPGGADDAYDADYNYARLHREPLTVLEREAPMLMPLYPALVHFYEMHAEPKQQLRAAFVKQYGAPRHWRRFLRLPPDLLAWVRKGPRCQAHAWLDLAIFSSWLDTPDTLTVKWMQVLSGMWAGAPVNRFTGEESWRQALIAHLRAWHLADNAGRRRLAVELAHVRHWLEDQDDWPEAPPQVMRWGWWARKGTAWFEAKRNDAAQAPPLPDANELRSVAEAGGSLVVEPLRTAVHYVQESEPMVHCLVNWVAAAIRGDAVAWSVIDAVTGARVATAGLNRAAGSQLEIKGHANTVLPPQLERRIRALVEPELRRWLARRASLDVGDSV